MNALVPKGQGQEGSLTDLHIVPASLFRDRWFPVQMSRLKFWKKKIDVLNVPGGRLVEGSQCWLFWKKEDYSAVFKCVRREADQRFPVEEGRFMWRRLKKKVLTRMENEKHYEGFVNFEDGGSEGTISASLSLALCFHDEVTIFFYEQYSSFFYHWMIYLLTPFAF